MFFPTTCFLRQKSHDPEIIILSLQQDVNYLFGWPAGGKRWIGRYLGAGSGFVTVGLTIFMLICGCYIQSAEGLPSLTVYGRENIPNAIFKNYNERQVSPRTLFSSPSYIEGSQNVEESQRSSSTTHQACNCDGKWMRACSEECIRKNTTSVTSTGAESSFPIPSGGQVIESLASGGTPSSGMSYSDSGDDESEKFTDPVDAAGQDLEELINALKCECKGQVKPSCVSACAMRNEIGLNTSANANSCYCDGKWLDSCPQKCLSTDTTTMEDIGKTVGTITSGFSQGSGGSTNSLIINAGSSTSSGGIDSAKYISIVAGTGMGKQIIGDSNGGINITTGKLNPIPQVQIVGPPCICEGKYHRVCSAECLKLATTKQLPFEEIPGSLPMSNFAPLPNTIGIVHPDHAPNDVIPVIDLELLPNKTNLQKQPPLPPKSALLADRVGETFVEKNGEIIMHRKVYVTERPKLKSVITPFKITIPIELEEAKAIFIDPPPPVFKSRTYTEYETKPETVQMPVVTTVIKPKNVRREQLVY